MKILFVHPPLNPMGEVTPPLGICSLAGWVQYHGHTAQVLDFDLELKSGEQQERFTGITTALTTSLQAFTPQVICVTSMYSNSLYAEFIIRQAKNINPNIVTVAGGSHFGAQGELSLQRIPQLDYVIEGESETALLELLAFIKDGGDITRVHNLVYRDASIIKTNSKAALIDLSVLPNTWLEVQSIIDIQRYADTIPAAAERKIMYVEAGRGCPFNCSFCATAPFWNRKYRVKEPDLIIAEIEFLHSTFGYNSFVLIHDLLPVSKKFISELCDKMIDKKIPVEWMMNSRTDIDLTGYLPKLRAAGCWKFFYGVESSSGRIQEAITKNLDRKETIDCLKTNLEHGISSTCSFVIGFPDESPAEISQSVKLAAICKMNGAETVQFHRLRLFPPSRLSKQNLETEFDLDSLRIEYPFIDISPGEISEIEKDPGFFMGYHSPKSIAGSKEQLAQLEMFFHHGIALMPITIALCCGFYKDNLVAAFYEVLETRGILKREDIEWQSSDLFRNWEAVRPLLNALIKSNRELPLWQSQLLHAVFKYKNARLQFCINDSVTRTFDDLVDKGDSWVAVHSGADIFNLVTAITNEATITESYLAPCIIVISSKGGRNLAYSFDMKLEKKLQGRDEEIMSIIEEYA